MEEANDKNIELIDKHLAGQLSEQDESLFQQKIQNDPDFVKVLSEMRALKGGIQISELRRVHDLLKSEEKEILKNEKIAIEKPKFFYFIKIAATLIGLALGVWWVTSQFSTKQTDFFDDYFVPQTNRIVNIDKGSTESNALIRTFSYYDNGKYDEAIIGLNKLIEENKNDDYRFYKANALLATNQLDAAIPILEDLINEKNSQFTKDTKWILALAYLKKKEFSKAKNLLNGLLSHSFYGSKAQIILNELN